MEANGVVCFALNVLLGFRDVVDSVKISGDLSYYYK